MTWVRISLTIEANVANFDEALESLKAMMNTHKSIKRIEVKAV
jgi:hypothetical protein